MEATKTKILGVVAANGMITNVDTVRGQLGFAARKSQNTDAADKAIQRALNALVAEGVLKSRPLGWDGYAVYEAA